MNPELLKILKKKKQVLPSVGLSALIEFNTLSKAFLTFSITIRLEQRNVKRLIINVAILVANAIKIASSRSKLKSHPTDLVQE